MNVICKTCPQPKHWNTTMTFEVQILNYKCHLLWEPNNCGTSNKDVSCIPWLWIPNKKRSLFGFHFRRSHFFYNLYPFFPFNLFCDCEVSPQNKTILYSNIIHFTRMVSYSWQCLYSTFTYVIQTVLKKMLKSLRYGLDTSVHGRIHNRAPERPARDRRFSTMESISEWEFFVPENNKCFDASALSK